jgi:PPOX class probable F420-dependent enzyme
MQKQQIDGFLQQAKVCRIATVREDGAPHVVPVIYEWDGEHLFIIARKRAGWVDHLRREPRVSVLIDEEPLPQRKVLIDGIAEIVGTDWVEMGKRILGRYLGRKVTDKYLQGTIDQPRWLVKITPKKIITWHNPPQLAEGKAAWHPRYYEPGTKWYKEHQKEKRTKRRLAAK